MGSNPRTLPSHAYPIAKRRSYWKWQMRSQVSRNSMCMWIRFCCLYFQIDPYSVENEFMLSLELRYTVRSQIGSPLHGTRPTMCFDAWLTYSGLKQNVGDFYDFLELLNHQARAKPVILILTPVFISSRQELVSPHNRGTKYDHIKETVCACML